MKKSQRARLAELAGKTSLSSDESAEKARLEALASQHPDASLDTDDAPPARRDFRAILAGMVGSVRDRGLVAADLSTAQRSLATATAERDEARGQVAERDTRISALISERDTAVAALETFCTFLGLKLDTVKGKDGKAVAEALEQHVSAAATEKLAELGFPASKLPAASDGNVALESLADVQAKMATEQDPAELGRLAARANKLRDQIHGKN